MPLEPAAKGRSARPARVTLLGGGGGGGTPTIQSMGRAVSG